MSDFDDRMRAIGFVQYDDEPKPWLDDGDVKLYHGDALEQLALMPSESVQCIVTSPPFWGLRDYGTGSWTGGDADCDHESAVLARHGGFDGNNKNSDGTARTSRHAGTASRIANECRCGARRVDQQIGLEETPDEWCARLVAVMREARRVLRNDGVCWIEVGDTYARGRSGRDDAGLTSTGREAGWVATSPRERTDRNAPDGYKEKDLVGAPWLLAFALRADGWYLRSDTIWARPNPMPESVTDRPTKAHSYVFLLTKSARYFMDMDAIREEVSPNWSPGNAPTVGEHGDHVLKEGHSVQRRLKYDTPKGANARSVWSIATEPTPFAHFATFPQALVERCIKAGTSEHGACGECGAPWRRITEVTPSDPVYVSGKNVHNADRNDKGRNNFVGGGSTTLGWEPSCAHDAPITPCRVLDPFVGSGTTCLVARRLGRHAIGIELNAEYLRIAAKRLEQLSLFAEPTTEGTK